MDRPGDWGSLYDRILDQVQLAGDLLIEAAPPGIDPFEFAGLAILNEADRLSKAGNESQAAILVWDGIDSGPGDMTSNFAMAAKDRGVPLLQVSTLE